ncbi:hypothetical protein PtA15_5A577 [Puccinia triticina]|uniref:Uncharacterized protein n=1 Tax=Puccinia triticina TaxID=208348 RepID=A0ABY7CIE3_9BASI|nr:uncharacterized protein PtA15_5A577 [Puccinia triticina]WAQ85004.1 hypothetical protein PtA15_5A577 [Puccinia triticina]WAR58342.1 hypothetical protein PtB15_5B576 [Puccinia triticina]
MPRSPNSPSASHPPSRHSTRAITPVRADTNFVRPNNDSRKSLPSTSIVPDSTQNVVQNSSQVSKKRKRRDDGLDVDDVDDYFHKPRFAEDLW